MVLLIRSRQANASWAINEAGNSRLRTRCVEVTGNGQVLPDLVREQQTMSKPLVALAKTQKSFSDLTQAVMGFDHNEGSGSFQSPQTDDTLPLPVRLHRTNAISKGQGGFSLNEAVIALAAEPWSWSWGHCPALNTVINYNEWRENNTTTKCREWPALDALRNRT